MSIDDPKIIRLAEAVVPARFNELDLRELFSNRLSDPVAGAVIDENYFIRSAGGEFLDGPQALKREVSSLVVNDDDA